MKSIKIYDSSEEFERFLATADAKTLRKLHKLVYGTWLDRLHWKLRGIWMYRILRRRCVLGSFVKPTKTPGDSL